MRFIKDGPDIPLEVIQALEEERVVIICGAGVSKKAGLPTFHGLVCDLINRLGAKLDSIEQQEFDQKNYDRVIGLLERKDRFDIETVRKTIIEILGTPKDPDLSTHQALIKLATLRNKSIRLITTNFDNLFEEVDAEITISSAPTLPTPKPGKWNSLVHLHGRINDEDPFGKDLVLSSSDFGTAYLFERWASRFISELFNHFTVLFIGYGLNDPVMRYLVDAVAVERDYDGRIKEAYALVEYDQEENCEKISDTWKAKNIVPILYKNDENHKKLHDTLHHWSKIYEGGATSKLEIVKTIAPNDPETLSIEQVDQLCWAVFDKTTSTFARQFSNIKPSPPFSWLKVFEQRELFQKIQKSDNHTSLFGEYFNTNKPSSLSEHETEIGRWLTYHLENKEFIDWIIAKGAHLHPQFADEVQRKLLDDKEIKEPFKKVWSILISDHVYENKYSLFNYLKFKNVEWNVHTRQEILSLLDPCINVNKSFSFDFLRDEEVVDEISSVSDLATIDIELTLGDRIQSLIKILKARNDWADITVDIVFALVEKLRKAYELLEMGNVASKDYDGSHRVQPSIEPHDQNKHFQSQSVLIELLRDGIDELIERNSNKLKVLFKLLLQQPYPIFKRLSLYIAKIYEGPLLQDIYKSIIKNPNQWLWGINTRREMYQVMPNLWDNVNSREKAQLFKIVNHGPKSEIFRDDLPEDELNELIDRSRWNYIVRISHNSNSGLNKKQTSVLKSIDECRPNYNYRGTDREDFITWVESGKVVHRTDFTVDDLKSMTTSKRINVLLNHKENRRGLIDNWNSYCSKYPNDALHTLDAILSQHSFDEEIFTNAFYGFETKEIDASLIIATLNKLNLTQLSSVLRSASRLLYSLTKKNDDVPRGKYFEVWDKLFPLSLETTSPEDENTNKVSKAINHASGFLAYSLIYLIDSYELKKGDGLPDEFKERIEKIIQIDNKYEQLPLIIIGKYLPLLNSIAPSWTQKILIPLFDWSNKQKSISLWQGYLWTPSMNIELWQSLKECFFKTFKHFNYLDDGTKNLGQILALVYILDEFEINEKEIRESLKLLTDEDRSQFLRWIEIHLDNSEKEEREKIWKKKIVPFFNDIWPKERKFVSEVVSNKIATILLKSGEMFKVGVDSSLPFLTSRDHGHYHLDVLLNTQLMQKFPEATLKFVDKITPDDPPKWYGPLGKVLDQISHEKPDLKDDPRFKRLEEIAIRKNLYRF